MKFRYLSIFAVILLSLSFFNMPYGYYTFLRFVICISSALLAHRYFKSEKEAPSILFGVIAILFNPAIIIHFNKNVWMVIDALTIIIFSINILSTYAISDSLRRIFSKKSKWMFNKTNSQQFLIKQKLGCYVNSTDYRFGSMGIEWNKNYIYSVLEFLTPKSGTQKFNTTCPYCNKSVIIKVNSMLTCVKIRIFNAFVVLMSLVMLILLWFYDLRNFGLDKKQITVIKIWGTIFFLFIGLLNILKAYSKYGNLYPNIKWDIHFNFLKHKLFNEND